MVWESSVVGSINIVLVKFVYGGGIVQVLWTDILYDIHALVYLLLGGERILK